MLVEPQTPAALFVEVVAENRRLLLRLAHTGPSSRDAEDLLQEALAKAWAGLHRFSGNKADLRNWLCRIVRNAATDARRHEQARRWVPVALDDWRECLADNGTPEDTIIRQEQQREAQAQAATLLAQCTSGERRVLWAQAQQECTLSALAQQWGTTVQALKGAHWRGLRRCRALLPSASPSKSNKSLTV